MNYKFSRQSKRKPINTTDVNESRFENNDLFPKSLARNLEWNKNAPALEYEPVEVDKYKYNKVPNTKIKKAPPLITNMNHYFAHFHLKSGF